MKNNRNIRRMLSLLLVFALLMPYIGMSARSTDLPCAEDGCSGKYRNGICSVAGHLEAAPLSGGVYQISNAGQLYWFAELVNGGNTDSDAALTADITINADMDSDDKLQWIPIGLYTSARENVSYCGTFNGAGYTIYGLYYEDTAYTGRNAGFIGTLCEDGMVVNLTLADSVIIGSTEIGGIVSHNYGSVIGCVQAGSVSGTGATGGIVCRNMAGAVVEDCVNTGAVSGATTGGIAAENNGHVMASVNTGAINGTSSVGGIIGMNDGIVVNVLNNANVTASSTHVGGVIGNMVGGELSRSGNTGNVTGASDYIGGVAGACVGAGIFACYNTGKVTGDNSKSEAVGGVVGAIDGTNTDVSSLVSCYNTGKVSGKSWVGGIAGISGYQKTPETVTFGNSYNTGSVEGTSHIGAVVGKLTKGTADGIFYLQGSAQSSVSGATAATAEQFASGEIAAKLNETSNVWYQALDLVGMEPDASPVLDPEHGTVYAGYCNCSEQGYTNRENYDEPGDHVDDDWNMICDACGATLGEAHDHEFGEWTRTKEPTCSEFGKETRICSICNYPQTRNIDKLPHTEEIIPGTPATFDEPGLTDGKKCTVCGEVTVAQVEAPVRDYNEGIVPLSAVNVSAGDWERNGGSSEGPANLAVDDDMSTMWHTDWYGTSNENHWFQFELTEEYMVTGLRYRPRQTGNANGTITSYEIQVSNDGVNFETIASGNWENNRNWKVVEFEGMNVKYVRLASKAAYCDNSSIVCASAAEIRLAGYVAGQGHEHSYEAVVTDPTCTEGGYTTYTCSCGDTYVADETAALGHTEEVIPAVDASCTETGLTEGKKCSVCDEILVAQEIIPALGHSWKGTGCENCDEVRENPFVDVNEKTHASFFDAILWAVEEGITTGTDATHFNPNGKCDRATIVTFLWRAAGKPEPTTTENPFVDVKESHFFYKAVLWAYENGITTGIDATHFNPYGKCTRAQVVTFLWRAEGKPAPTSTESTFSDVTNAKEFYYNAVLWAAENGITNGINATTFGVNSICNRAQVVTFLYRCAK